MYKIAIVDDEEKARSVLMAYLVKFGETENISFSFFEYPNGESFLDDLQKQNFDVIFLDIEMPGLNGIETGKKLRLVSKNSIVIFVTNLAQYAINGYSIHAYDYIVKPLNYEVFYLKMKEMLPILKRLEKHTLAVRLNYSKLITIVTEEILYVESKSHHIFYHMEDGNVHQVYTSLSSAEKMLPTDSFVRCNSCYVVNLGQIDLIDGEDVLLKNERLKISRPKKKSFVQAYKDYCKKI